MPEAFDTSLIGSNPLQFVYRNLDNTALDIVSGPNDKVDNRADELGLMNRIAPNKRVRGNLEKWASSTVSIRGGKIENSAAHLIVRQSNARALDCQKSHSGSFGFF